MGTEDQRNNENRGPVGTEYQRVQRIRETVGTEDQRNGRNRGPVGTEDQWEQRTSGNRGPEEQRTRGTVDQRNSGPEEQ